MNLQVLAIIVTVTLLSLLAACGGDGAGRASIEDNIDVGGYRLHYVCEGKGSPTVIIESGLGDPAGYDPQFVAITGLPHSWVKVIPKISPETRICRYSRAGLGLSQKAPTPRTSQDMVADLHALLNNAHIEPPYVLVAHSIGGLNARLYARTYPDEVVGMVLVDASHPDYWTKLRDAFPPVEPDELLILTEMRKLLFSPGENPEGMDIDASAEEVRNAGQLGNIPLIVITRAFGTSGLPAELPPEFVQVIEQQWQELQVDLTALSTNNTHVIAMKSGHYIQIDEPHLVIDAILKVVDDARNRPGRTGTTFPGRGRPDQGEHGLGELHRAGAVGGTTEMGQSAWQRVRELAGPNLTLRQLGLLGDPHLAELRAWCSVPRG